MRERPILFSGEMVRAILSGRKSYTRRVVKLPTWADPGSDIELCDKDGQGQSAIDWPNVVCKSTGCLAEIPCPYGGPGGRLWVRETFASRRDVDWATDPEKARRYIHYRADGGFDPKDEDNWHDWGAWRPAIHMPRCLSRLTLEIASVRVERLHQMTAAEAVLEGFTTRIYRDGRGQESALHCFRELWNELNGKKYPWESNPWVWRIEFKPTPTTEARE